MYFAGLWISAIENRHEELFGARNNASFDFRHSEYPNSSNYISSDIAISSESFQVAPEAMDLP